MAIQLLVGGITAGVVLGALFVVGSYVSFLLDRRRRGTTMFKEFGPLPGLADHSELADDSELTDHSELPDNVVSLATYRREPTYRIIDEATARAMHPSMRGLPTHRASDGRS